MKQRLFLALILSAVAAAAVRAEIVERVIARVNGDIVTLSEFEARQIASVQGARVPPEQVETYLRENNQRILQEAIDDLLITQRGSDLGIKPRPEYIDGVIDNIKKENNITTDGELHQQLRREGMSLTDLKRSIERSVVRRQVLAHALEQKAVPSDAEARAYYDSHRDEFEQRESVTLQEIVVKTAAEAANVVRRARAGEDFAGLARTQSTAATRDSGGELGRIARGDLAPALERTVFALPVGGVSEPVQAGADFRVLRVKDKTAPGGLTFDQARAGIIERLGANRVEQQYKAYVEGLRQNAAIQVTVREVPLQVDVEATESVLRPAGPATVADPDAEIVTTPQARPQYVPPPGAPVAPQAGPRPVPTPAPAAGERP